MVEMIRQTENRLIMNDFELIRDMLKSTDPFFFFFLLYKWREHYFTVDVLMIGLSYLNLFSEPFFHTFF